jgi:dynein heavy chain, axonemal
MAKFNRLLKTIKASLSELDDAIHGYTVMSEVLDAMFINIQNGLVPKNWESVAYPSLKPLASWYLDLRMRVDFLKDWLENGNPKCYWISGFFFPQGFLTGCLQTHARQYRIPIDELEFAFTVLVEEGPEEIEECPEDGVIINGFFMDGARWNREEQCVDEQNPVSKAFEFEL